MVHGVNCSGSRATVNKKCGKVKRTRDFEAGGAGGRGAGTALQLRVSGLHGPVSGRTAAAGTDLARPPSTKLLP
eukprot:2235664-Rhodomonas_salina.1